MTVFPLASRSAVWVLCSTTSAGKSDCLNFETVSVLRTYLADQLVMLVRDKRVAVVQSDGCPGRRNLVGPDFLKPFVILNHLIQL